MNGGVVGRLPSPGERQWLRANWKQWCEWGHVLDKTYFALNHGLCPVCLPLYLRDEDFPIPFELLPPTPRSP